TTLFRAQAHLATAAVCVKTAARVLAHSLKVGGKSANSRAASAGGHPFSRRQRARTSLVEDTNETDCHLISPLCRYWRCTIHWSRSAASAHLPEIANCRSAMGALPNSSSSVRSMSGVRVVGKTNACGVLLDGISAAR